MRSVSLAALAALLVAAWAAAPARAVAPPAPPDPSFCEGTVVRDFLAPTKRMPKLRSPRRDGTLPFRPRGIGLFAWHPGLEPKADEEIGYVFSLRRHAPARPRWRVDARLELVDWRGRRLKQVAGKRRQVRRLGRDRRRLNLKLPLPRRIGFYRYSAEFRGPSGKLLGRLGFYARVMAPVKRIRLALSSPTYTPGQTVLGRIENLGTGSVYFGSPYRIERYDGGVWTRAPETPQAFPMPLYTAGSGLSSPCSPFRIPHSMPLGRYRMVKEVDFAIGQRAQSATIAAEFDVVIH